MANPVTRLSEAESVAIASGQSLSASINLGGRIPTGVYMPAAWTAAGLSFQASQDGSAWYDIHGSGGEVTTSASAGIYVGLNTEAFYGVNFLKVRSGTSGSPVVQGADRALSLMLGKPVVDC